MRLFIDSDMLLDFVAERPQTREAWNKLNALELTGTAELWVGASSFERVRSALATAVADGRPGRPCAPPWAFCRSAPWTAATCALPSTTAAFPTRRP